MQWISPNNQILYCSLIYVTLLSQIHKQVKLDTPLSGRGKLYVYHYSAVELISLFLMWVSAGWFGNAGDYALPWSSIRFGQIYGWVACSGIIQTEHRPQYSPKWKSVWNLFLSSHFLSRRNIPYCPPKPWNSSAPLKSPDNYLPHIACAEHYCSCGCSQCKTGREGPCKSLFKKNNSTVKAGYIFLSAKREIKSCL